MENKKLTDHQIVDYNRDGYLIVKNFCSTDEIDKLYSTAVNDDAMRKNALDLNDQSGKKRAFHYGLPQVMMCLVI